jgi:nucleoside-triphosphatase THEP1
MKTKTINKKQNFVLADVSNSVSFIMFKVSSGKKVHEFRLESISEHHAITVAENFYRANGLIGRYYCETENGKMFQINY